MPKYFATLFICLIASCTFAQTTHSIEVSINQGARCPVVTGLENSHHIAVFPNPVNTSSFTIQSDLSEGRVELHDLRGTIIHRGNLVDGKLEVKVSEINSGIYIINIIETNRIHRLKIQIK